jgi:FlaA1/EpsC-like NDP-sugar epimerase
MPFRTAVVANLVEMPRPAKRVLAVVIDSAICLLTVWFAFYLRLGQVPDIGGLRYIAVVASLSALPIFWAFGLYHVLFRYLGLDALVAIVRACLVYGLLYAVIFTLLEVSDTPRTVGIIQPLLLFLFVTASRAFARSLLGSVVSEGRERRVLIYGAGASGRQLAAAIRNSGEMDVVGYVDDEPTLHGQVLNGRRIYSSDELATIVGRKQVTDIFLALPSASRKRRSEIVDALRPFAVEVATIPGLMDLASGRVEVSALRPLDIEDLLGRDVAAPNEALFARNILDKTVMVTGAGGSIGSELCRQILSAKPRVLLLVEVSEIALYAIDAELRAASCDQNEPTIIPLLASVGNAIRMHAIMAAWRPDTVYHTAAYKHVPLVEHNPAEGVLNNAFGTLTTARLARQNGVSDFVLISTDKAVRPTNVMGTTKRLAEMCLQALASEPGATRYSMVRFGNVLGSSGSVVPLFRAQIAAGGPVTVTHDEVTRYFMTIPEAAQLVIQAGAMAQGGDVFILDMGEPVKIIDLARKMIELSGLSVRDDNTPDGDIAVKVVGLRPGEKLYEELLIGCAGEETAHPLIMRAVESHLPLKQLEKVLDRLLKVAEANDAQGIITVLCEAVPEFKPAAGIVDWLQGNSSKLEAA